MTTSPTIFTATPQFDGGRWKLRLEYAPLDFAKQNRASMPFEWMLAGTENRSRCIPLKNEHEATQ